MIIDSHAHVVLPTQVTAYIGELVANRANPDTKRGGVPTDEVLREVADGLVSKMDEVGTDMQFLSPRPYLQMHSVKPARVTETWTRTVNDLIYRQCQMYPDRFRGIAGLPQYRDTSPSNSLEELDRCVSELGFIGCLLNPDPTEGDALPPPGLGDRFWYPLYEKLVELDIPALVHCVIDLAPRLCSDLGHGKNEFDRYRTCATALGGTQPNGARSRRAPCKIDLDARGR